MRGDSVDFLSDIPFSIQKTPLFLFPSWRTLLGAPNDKFHRNHFEFDYEAGKWRLEIDLHKYNVMDLGAQFQRFFHLIEPYVIETQHQFIGKIQLDQDKEPTYVYSNFGRGAVFTKNRISLTTV
jgi:hypothetical protein